MIQPVASKVLLSQNPIFVVGYPRSGTTLLQALLAAQGGVASLPETHFFPTLQKVLGEGMVDRISAVEARNLLRRIREVAKIELPDQLPIGNRDQAAKTIPVKELFEKVIRWALPPEYEADQRWLEKTPDHALWMVRMREYYPQARFVGIVRNPLFAIPSNIKLFKQDVTDGHLVLARHWQRHVLALEDFRQSHPEAIRIVRYEDLVADIEREVSALCDFLEIEFGRERLTTYQGAAEKTIQPFEHWKQDVLSPNVRNMNDAGKKGLAGEELRQVQYLIGAHMKNYAYPFQHGFRQKLYDWMRRPKGRRGQRR